MIIQARDARADIDLFSLAGAPVTFDASMRTREYVWSYFNPGPVANGNNNYQYNFQSNVIRFGAGYTFDGLRLFAEAMSPAELELPPKRARASADRRTRKRR